MDFDKKIELNITESFVKQYAAVSGDGNPIHLLKAAANQAGFPGQVAHGMLSMAIGAKFISPMLANGWALSHYKMKFSTPLFVNDILKLEAEFVTETEEKITLKVIGENQNQYKVVSGKIEMEKKND